MKNYLFYLTAALLMIGAISTKAQVIIKVENGLIYIHDGTFGRPNEKKYSYLLDSLDNNFTVHPKDTTSLFFKALLMEQFNNQLAKPSYDAKDALENLTAAKNLAEKAMALKMNDFRLKVLRAQVYKDLTYRYSNNESWKYSALQIAERKRIWNNYKDLANKYYDEIAVIDPNNAYDYQKLKVKNP